MINQKSNCFIMITYLFMINNDIYKFFHLDKLPQKQNFLNMSQGASHTSGHVQPYSSTLPQFM